MPAAGTRTSSSRIVVSGSLRPPARVRSRSRPRRRRLRRPPSPSSSWSVVLVVLLVLPVLLVCWSCWSCWSCRSCWFCWPAGSAGPAGPGCAAGSGSPWPPWPPWRFALLALLAVLVALRCSLALLAVLRRAVVRTCRRTSCRRCASSRALLALRGPGAVLALLARLAVLLALLPRLGLAAPDALRPAGWPVLAGLAAADWPPGLGALMASTSWAFFIEPAPLMPRPPASDLRSASSIVLTRRASSPPSATGASVVVSWVSVTVGPSLRRHACLLDAGVSDRVEEVDEHLRCGAAPRTGAPRMYQTVGRYPTTAPRVSTASRWCAQPSGQYAARSVAVDDEAPAPSARRRRRPRRSPSARSRSTRSSEAGIAGRR